MKTVVKSPAPACLAKAHSDGLNWDTFWHDRHDDYEAVREQALSDQKNECAYTGLWLGEGTTQQLHIDHYRRKGIFQELTFEWDNLFAAAKELDYGSDYKDSKAKWEKKVAISRYSEFWSPLDPAHDKAYWFRQDGNIEPHESLSAQDKEMAQRTIDIFNLNAPDLKKKREGLIKQLRELGAMTDEEVRMVFETSGFSFLVDFELKNRRP